MTGSKKHLKPLKTRELGKAKIERRLTASWRLRFSWNFAGRRPWVTDQELRTAFRPGLERRWNGQECDSRWIRYLLQQYPDAAELPRKSEYFTVQCADSQSFLSQRLRCPEPDGVLFERAAHGDDSRSAFLHAVFGTIHGWVFTGAYARFLHSRRRRIHAYREGLAKLRLELSECGRRPSAAGLCAHPRSPVDLAIQVQGHVCARGKAFRQEVPVPGLIHACLKPRRQSAST